MVEDTKDIKMNKQILFLILIIISSLKVDGKVGYNYPHPDIINISNDHNDYYINLTNGVSLTNHFGEYWSKDYIGIRVNTNTHYIDSLPLSWYLYNGTRCELYFLNKCWLERDYVTLYGITNLSLNRKFGVNYTLLDGDNKLGIGWWVNNTGVLTITNSSFLWKISDIKINNDYEYDAYKDYNPHYDLFNNTFNNTYNDILGNYFHIEDYIASNGIEVWWNDTNGEVVRVMSDGNTTREVILEVINPTLTPNLHYEQKFYYDDAPVCSGSCGTLTITDTCRDINETISCAGFVGDYVEYNLTVSGTCITPPSSECQLQWQSYHGAYTLIGTSNNQTENYCQKYPTGQTTCEKNGDYRGTWTAWINCTKANTYQLRGWEELKGTSSTGLSFVCYPVNLNPIINYQPPTPDNNSVINISNIEINNSIKGRARTSGYIDFNRSLLLYLPFDYFDTNRYFDNSTWKHHGEKTNTRNTTYIYGDNVNFSQGLSFINLSKNHSEMYPEQFTVEFWYIAPTDSLIAVQQGILDWNYNLTNLSGVRIMRLTVFTNEWIVFSEGNGTFNLEESISLTNSKVWNYIVLTYNGTMVSYYVNNVLIDSSELNDVVFRKDDDIIIGAYFDNNALSNYLNGSIDEFRIHNRVLTHEEMENSYNYKTTTKNRLYKNFDGLSSGEYNFTSCVINTEGFQNCEQTRKETIIEQITEILKEMEEKPEIPLVLFLMMIFVLTNSIIQKRREVEIEKE